MMMMTKKCSCADPRNKKEVPGTHEHDASSLASRSPTVVKEAVCKCTLHTEGDPGGAVCSMPRSNNSNHGFESEGDEVEQRKPDDNGSHHGSLNTTHTLKGPTKNEISRQRAVRVLACLSLTRLPPCRAHPPRASIPGFPSARRRRPPRRPLLFDRGRKSFSITICCREKSGRERESRDGRWGGMGTAEAALCPRHADKGTRKHASKNAPLPAGVCVCARTSGRRWCDTYGRCLPTTRGDATAPRLLVIFLRQRGEISSDHLGFREGAAFSRMPPARAHFFFLHLRPVSSSSPSRRACVSFFSFFLVSPFLT